jgi:hypothetical protein
LRAQVPAVKELLSSITFAIFVGVTTIQCHYEGAVRVALTMVAGVALWLSMYLFPGMRKRQDK